MKLTDIFKLLKEHKSIAILTPNSIECKLLIDRICLKRKNVKRLDRHTVQINKSKIVVCDTEHVYLLNNSTYVIVEFLNQMPEYISTYLPPVETIVVNSEII